MHKVPQDALNFVKAAALTGALFLACIGVLFTVHARLRIWLYREISYRVIKDKISQEAHSGRTGTLAITQAVADFVQQQVYPGGGPVIDTDSWTHLVRSVGWCDQKG